MPNSNKIALYGFNNLTKNLSFSLYKVDYLHDESCEIAYQKMINECYASDKLSLLLSDICHAIGGNILNIASQNYQPHGASVTLMISEEAQPESLVAHLDKSHLCIHTYPDDNPQNGIAIFRADIELSTCGIISPLKIINHVIEEFNSDVVDIDYRIRGMTRDKLGKKFFSDEEVGSISHFINTEIKEKYDIENNMLLHRNIFHTRLARKNTTNEETLFLYHKIDLKEKAHKKIQQQIEELFNS
jgi:S-adenosylmethionine decarboxylase